MIEIKYKRDTDLSADTVWEELRHYDRVLKWIPRGDESRITIKGEGIGMIRDIELATQGYVQHKLVAFDNDKRMFSYTLTASMQLMLSTALIGSSAYSHESWRASRKSGA